MSQEVRDNIFSFLSQNEEEMLQDLTDPTLEEVAEILIDRCNGHQIELAIMEHAYEKGVPYKNYDLFYEEVIARLDQLPEDQDATEEMLDGISQKFI